MLQNLVRCLIDMCKTFGIVLDVSHDQNSVIFTDIQVATSMKMLRNTFGASRGQQIPFQDQERRLGAHVANRRLDSRRSVIIG